MAILLGILSILILLIGIGYLFATGDKFYGILALMSPVIFAILLSTAAIVSAINSLKKQITKEDVIIHSESKNNQNP